MGGRTDKSSGDLVAGVCSGMAMGVLGKDKGYRTYLTDVAQRVIEYGEQCVNEVREELKQTKDELKTTKEELKVATDRIKAMSALIDCHGD